MTDQPPAQDEIFRAALAPERRYESIKLGVPHNSQPGDLALYQMHTSWTHGAIVLSWPKALLHPIKGRGVIGSQADEGMLRGRPVRFFSFVD